MMRKYCFGFNKEQYSSDFLIPPYENNCALCTFSDVVDE